MAPKKRKNKQKKPDQSNKNIMTGYVSFRNNLYGMLWMISSSNFEQMLSSTRGRNFGILNYAAFATKDS